MTRVLTLVDLPGATPSWLQSLAETMDWGSRWVEDEWMPTEHLKEVLEDVEEYAGSQYPDLAWSLKHGHWRDWLTAAGKESCVE
jgi:hypothetical protein